MSKKGSKNSKKQTRSRRGQPLEHEEFYHGLLPREDVEKLLRKEGDFLVRHTEVSSAKQYVLSVFWEGKSHHVVIQRTAKGKYKLDALECDSISDVVRYHWQKGTPTGVSRMILKLPIARQDWELHHENVDLKKGRKLGEGAYGEVWSGELNFRGKAVPVAVKKSHLSQMSKEDIRDMMKEMRLLRHYDHPNIVKLYGVAADKEPLLFVLELVTGGALDKYLKKHAATIEISQRVDFCIDAAKGLAYLHKRNCIHRDIASRNCLITTSNVVKIADFGLSFQGDTYKARSNRKLPIKWLSVETMSSAIFSSKSDVWSYGVLMWEIFSDGEEPYSNMRVNQVMKEVKTGYRLTPPVITPPKVGEIMCSCWDADPSKRPSMHRLVSQLKQAVKTPSKQSSEISKLQSKQSDYTTQSQATTTSVLPPTTEKNT